MKKALLIAGAISAPLYIGIDIALAFRYHGYQYADQAVSELFATGAPTRNLWLAFSVPYNLLILALAAGIWWSARERWAARVAAGGLVVFAIVGMAGAWFFQMAQRGADASLREELHGPVTLVMSIGLIVAMVAAARLLGWRFRLYTYATIVVLIAFGIWTSFDVSRVADGDPTPWMGIKERVNIYASLLWIAVLGTSLVRTPPAATAQLRPIPAPASRRAA